MNNEFVVNAKTERELLEIAISGNRNTTLSVLNALEKKHGSVDEKRLTGMLSSISNLTGPKTVEGRIKVLMNLKGSKKEEKKKKFDPQNPHKYFLDDDDEIALYEFKRSLYTEDFELNASSDWSILEQILMIEVEIFRLTKKQKEYDLAKSTNSTTKLTSSEGSISNRRDDLKKLIQVLGTDRKTRTGGKEDKSKDIATLATEYDVNKAKEFKAKQSEMQEEEENLLLFEERRQKELSELGLLNKGFNAEEHTKKLQ